MMGAAKKRGRGLGDIVSTLTIAVLFLVILLLVVFSASGYQRAVELQDGSSNTRAVLSYVITCVKDNSTGEILPGNIDGAPGLTIRDSRTGYEQRIYLVDGQLLEEYGMIGQDSDPAGALVIGQVSSFEARLLEDGVLEVRTDLGVSYVSTRK